MADDTAHRDTLATPTIPQSGSEPTKKTVMDETEYLHQNKLFQMCRPFLRVLRIGGLFFIRPGTRRNQPPGDAVNAPKSHGYSWRHRIERFFGIYSVFVLVINLIFAGQIISGVVAKFSGSEITYENLGLLVMAITYVLWTAQLLTIQCILLKSCWKKSGIVTFFICWEELKYRCSFDSCKCGSFSKKFESRIKRLSIIAVVHLLVAIAGQITAVALSDGALSQFLVAGLPKDTMSQTAVLISDCIASVYYSFICIVPSYLFLAVSFVINFDFFHLVNDMKSSIKATELPGWIEWFRLRHNSLCILLEEGDKQFSSFILTTFISNILQVLLIIFQLYDMAQKGTAEPIKVAFSVFYLLTFFGQIFIIYSTGASLNGNAHAPSERLYDLNTNDLTETQTLHLQTFLSKLTCTEIGFSAWKMLTVTSSTVMALMGTYLTYQILVFQLQLDLKLKANIEKLPCSCTAENTTLTSFFLHNRSTNPH